MIDKVGAIILMDQRILVQRKNNNREECIIPGGKRENKETDLEVLKRELIEELTVDLVHAEYFGEYDDIAVFSGKPIHVKAYLTEISGEVKSAHEIKESLWIDRNYQDQGIKVGSILGDHIIPKLIEKGLM